MRALLPDPTDELTPEELEDRYLVAGRYVRANMIASLDGAIELEGRSGGLGGLADRQLFMTLRAVSDVVMVGSGTAALEKYGPARLDPEVRERRIARGQTPTPPIAVVTEGGGHLDLAGRLFAEDPSGPRPIVITTEPVARRMVAPVQDVIAAGDAVFDLGAALDQLAARGLSRVVCEGGPRLLSRLVGGGLLDELCLTHAPVLAGTGHASMLAGEPLDAPVRWTVGGLLFGDGLLMARYVREAT
jgi:riboflavin biosynthesis pyrimidine reductase